MKIWITAAIALVLFGAWFSQQDDPLDPEVKRWLSLIDADAYSPSYLYLLGMGAAEGQDPAVVGKKVLEVHQQWDMDVERRQHERQTLLPKKPPDGEAFCSFKQTECVAYLFGLDVAEIRHLMMSNQWLIVRNNRFLAFGEFTTMTKPAIDEHVARYSYVVRAERLELLQAVALYHQGDARQALDTISQRLVQLRQMLSDQDTLIGVALYADLITNLLDLKSLILHRESLASSAITSLSQNETDIRVALARELTMLYKLFKDLDRNPDLLEIGGELPGWQGRLLFKPHMTINAELPWLEAISRLTMLTPAQYDLAVERLPSLEEHWIRNPVGTVLQGVARSEYSTVRLLINLKAKIDVFNQLYSERSGLSDQSNIAFERGYACPSDIDHKNYERCLRVAVMSQ